MFHKVKNLLKRFYPLPARSSNNNFKILLSEIKTIKDNINANYIQHNMELYESRNEYKAELFDLSNQHKSELLKLTEYMEKCFIDNNAQIMQLKLEIDKINIHIIKEKTKVIKNDAEIKYWLNARKFQGGELKNEHYEYFYTDHFKLTKSFYNNKRILDIGCGPRGSLEWATNAKTRIDLDTIANLYRDLGIMNHNMTYVFSDAENMPFTDGYFDIITSFNSLDHVDNLAEAINQIKLKLKPGGLFLLLTDVNHNPTPAEPQVLKWDVVKMFEPEFDIIEEDHYEKSSGLYRSIQSDNKYDHNNPQKRYGILSAKFLKT